ncbi:MULTISPECIES: biopolymer transporter ExbD [unclassified Mucilaginibacter]|uniref:ExbD/TolR family protein n=1 Tax=unclassified Mucilaginibacter TaxID=2617802 RepID=UPI002AC9E17E|nr:MULTISPECIES: biopolymer transporter ExbD [unclassified Mucilaginibacter]MEB0264130.1 biopolymer transporter ExbD [Mucilaginibacter sp. 10I4]MEB0276907.1 biopolymer transporter ExbD [Mucilaginibacter sp. 10B2]MEB0300773.1 biopolymer transporter ExbD [Mucilaginibacter sp. 5C4]WPX25007.1 biopolymer transporter ExbD [Mucilaginibacter sp. 5C4]
MAELNSSPEKSGTKTRSKKAALKVDLTAMVDLAFLLITFFMLTTTLSKPSAMDVAMPVGEESEPVAQSRTMTICLGKNNKAMYYLGLADKPLIPATVTNYSGSGLRKAIFDMSKHVQQTTGKSMLIIIKPAETSVYGNLVNTLDEMKITSTQQYAIADIAPKDISLLKEQQAY